MRIISMPIFHGHGGGAPPELLIALLIVLNIFILFWIVIRYFIIRKRKIIESFIGQMFFDKDYKKYPYTSNYLNIPMMFFILINLIAIILWSTFTLMIYL